ncbi:MFS transporter [Dactylosporangium sp. McL0621]|uniref:MFS transporter n=1 Tax=Dactylosporangium sp. McL0621 TaxID=3415678 RepID=UPI003CFB5EBF
MPADVRRLSRRGVGWALLSDAVPLYPLYALLFTDTGLSGGEISLLFALWSTVGIVAEVPTGALADRFSRRVNLVAAGLLQAAGFALWTALPSFAVFAAGFVLWGLGGALASGAVEALLYDGLRAAGHEHRYVRVSGQVTAAGLLAQVPAAVAAALLFPLGGYPLVGWVSVAVCLAAAALAARLPEVRTAPGGGNEEDDDGSGYFATLRDGVREAAGRPAVRTAALVLAALAGLDAVEEYFPLLVHDWGVPTALNPAATLVITVGGAAGAALAARAGRFAGWGLAGLMLAAGLALAAAAALDRPAGIVLVAVFYGLYRLVLVVADACLQAVIDGAARATVTSVAALATELSALLLFAAWALGGAWCVAVLTVGLAVTLLLPSHANDGERLRE